MSLAELREKAGLSQAGLASKMGISREMIVRYESGKADMRAGRIHTVAIALDVEPMEILNAIAEAQKLRAEISCAKRQKP